jgi:hypothetical protein
MKVVKKIIEYSAVEWRKVGDHEKVTKLTADSDKGILQTMSGIEVVLPGDWILEDGFGGVHRVTADNFKKFYAEVN